MIGDSLMTGIKISIIRIVNFVDPGYYQEIELN